MQLGCFRQDAKQSRNQLFLIWEPGYQILGDVASQYLADNTSMAEAGFYSGHQMLG